MDDWSDCGSDSGSVSDILSVSYESDGPYSSSDTEDECSEWREVKLRTVDMVEISFDPLQTELLDIAEKEWKTVLAQLKTKVTDICHDNVVSLTSILDVMLRSFIPVALDHVNKVLQRAGHGSVTLLDMMAYYRVVLLLVYFKKSPTVAYASIYYCQHINPILPQSTYAKIENALQQPYEQKPAYQPHPRIKELDDLLASISGFCFDRSNTIATNNNIQVPVLSSKLASRCGLKVKKIAKKKGPVEHVTTSVLTSLFLCSIIQHTGDSVQHCVNAGLMKLMQARKLTDVQLTNLLTCNKGYIANLLCDSNLKLQLLKLETRKKESNFIFTFRNVPDENQRLIPLQGAFGAYFATCKQVVQGRNDVTLYGAVVRDSGQVVTLTTSKPEFGQFKFHYITDKQPNEWTVEPMPRTGPIKQKIDDFVRELPQKLVQLTCTQREPPWIILKRFRITSNVSSRFIVRWVSSLTIQEIECIPGLRTVIKVIGYRIPGEVVEGAPVDKQRQHDVLMKYSKAKLQELCRKFAETPRSRVALAMNGNKAELVSRLLGAGFIPDIEGGTDATRSMENLLHDCWFTSSNDVMPRHDRSAVIATNKQRLGPFIDEHCPKYKLMAHREYGLITDKAKPWLATSFDGILFLEHSSEVGSHNTLIPVIGELKTRSSLNAIDAIRKISQKHGRFVSLCIDKEDVLHDRKKFHSVVPDRSNRQQLLHHCATMGMKHVLYIEASIHTIVYVVLVEFHEDLLQAYVKSCISAMEPYVVPFHTLSSCDSFETIEPIITKLQNNFGWAVDKETYLLHVALWNQLSSKVETTKKPLPACKGILPAMVSAWKLMKGGVDVFSRFLEKCKPKNGRHHLYGSLYSRAFFTLIVNSHLLYRAHKAGLASDMKFSDRFGTYEKFKTFLNSRGSIEDFCAEASESLFQVAAKWVAPENTRRPPETEYPRLSGLHLKRKLRTDFSAFSEELIGSTDMHHVGINEKGTYSDCIVCCRECTTDEHGNVVKHHVNTSRKSRRGYKTRFGCRQCFLSHRKKALRSNQDTFCTKQHPGVVPLCNFARFGPLDTRTCFQIHHECNGNYPNCPEPPRSGNPSGDL